LALELLQTELTKTTKKRKSSGGMLRQPNTESRLQDSTQDGRRGKFGVVEYLAQIWEKKKGHNREEGPPEGEGEWGIFPPIQKIVKWSPERGGRKGIPRERRLGKGGGAEMALLQKSFKGEGKNANFSVRKQDAMIFAQLVTQKTLRESPWI